MDKYNELLKSVEHNGDKYMPYEQAAGSIEVLQSVLNEKQKILTAAIADLTEGNDCKYCANIDRCSMHQIERNIAYRGCLRWLWRGATLMDKAAEVPSRKQ